MGKPMPQDVLAGKFWDRLVKANLQLTSESNMGSENAMCVQLYGFLGVLSIPIGGKGLVNLVEENP